LGCGWMYPALRTLDPAPTKTYATMVMLKMRNVLHPLLKIRFLVAVLLQRYGILPNLTCDCSD
jgi:hypothetical protein